MCSFNKIHEQQRYATCDPFIVNVTSFNYF